MPPCQVLEAVLPCQRHGGEDQAVLGGVQGDDAHLGAAGVNEAGVQDPAALVLEQPLGRGLDLCLEPGGGVGAGGLGGVGVGVGYP